MCKFPTFWDCIQKAMWCSKVFVVIFCSKARVPIFSNLAKISANCWFFFPIVNAYVLNQFSNHYYYLMHCSLSLPCVWKKEEITNPSTQVDLIDDDYKIVFELSMFALNIKREIYGIIKSFLYF
jgi:hypothetical protein